MRVKDGIAYLGVIHPPPTPRAGYYDGTVFMIDISNPQAPVELGVLPSGGYGWAPLKIELGLDRVYVAYEQEGLEVYDTTDSSAPARIGSFEPSEPVVSLSLSGDVIYLYNKSIFMLRYDEAAYLANRAYLPMVNKSP